MRIFLSDFSGWIMLSFIAARGICFKEYFKNEVGQPIRWRIGHFGMQWPRRIRAIFFIEITERCEEEPGPSGRPQEWYGGVDALPRAGSTKFRSSEIPQFWVITISGKSHYGGYSYSETSEQLRTLLSCNRFRTSEMRGRGRSVFRKWIGKIAFSFWYLWSQ